MKLQIASLFVLVASATAFAPSPMGARPTLSLGASADAAEAIKEAMAASEKYGAASPEARSAWDVVEEIDASTRHHQKDDIHSGAKQEVKEAAPKAEAVKVSPEAEMWNQKLKEAMADAKRLTEEKGATDPDTRIAWELVEELAATAAHHQTTGSG